MAGCDDRGSLAEILAWCRDYFEQRVNFRLADRRRSLPAHVLIDFGNRGLMGLVGERDAGGLGLSTSDAMRVIEYVAAADQSLAVALVIQNFLAGNAVRQHVSDALRDATLGEMARGRLLVSFALSEEIAGSDPRRITTTAARQGDGGWVLNGSKIWAGLAAWSGAIVTFARTGDGDGEGYGYTAFFVPQGLPGVRQGEECLTMGLRGIVQNRIEFDGVRLGPEHVLGSAGGGMEVAHGSMMLCRLAMGALSVGAMRRAIQFAATYATRRTIATGPMIDNPVVADLLREEVSRTRAAESYLEHLYQLLDSGGPLPDEYLLACKAVLPEWMWHTVDRSLQLLGGRGYDEANGFARLFRDARVIRVFEGATEVMASHLGGKVLIDPTRFSGLLRDLGASGIADDVDEVATVVLAEPARRDRGRPGQLRDRFHMGRLSAHALVAAAIESRGDRAGTNAAEFARDAFARERVDFHADLASRRAWKWSSSESMASLFEGLPDLEAEGPGEGDRHDSYLKSWRQGD